jgi:hypothetical protein
MKNLFCVLYLYVNYNFRKPSHLDYKAITKTQESTWWLLTLNTKQMHAKKESCKPRKEQQCSDNFLENQVDFQEIASPSTHHGLVSLFNPTPILTVS